MGRRQVSATRPARVSPRFDASWGRDALVSTVSPAPAGGTLEKVSNLHLFARPSDLPASDMASLPVVNLDALVAMLDSPASGACP